MITIGITAATSREAVALARACPTVHAAVGIQPNYVSQAAPDDWAIIEQLATQPKVVAIGETGLDRYWDYAPFDVQVEFFDKHLELARRLDLPFVVHCREAESDVVAQLRRAAAGGPLRGVMHSFSGDAETALACVKLGLFYFVCWNADLQKRCPMRSVAAPDPARPPQAGRNRRALFGRRLLIAASGMSRRMCDTRPRSWRASAT